MEQKSKPMPMHPDAVGEVIERLKMGVLNLDRWHRDMKDNISLWMVLHNKLMREWEAASPHALAEPLPVSPDQTPVEDASIAALKKAVEDLAHWHNDLAKKVDALEKTAAEHAAVFEVNRLQIEGLKLKVELALEK